MVEMEECHRPNPHIKNHSHQTTRIPVRSEKITVLSLIHSNQITPVCTWHRFSLTLGNRCLARFQLWSYNGWVKVQAAWPKASDSVFCWTEFHIIGKRYSFCNHLASLKQRRIKVEMRKRSIAMATVLARKLGQAARMFIKSELRFNPWSTQGRTDNQIISNSDDSQCKKRKKERKAARWTPSQRTVNLK